MKAYIVIEKRYEIYHTEFIQSAILAVYINQDLALQHLDMLKGCNTDYNNYWKLEHSVRVLTIENSLDVNSINHWISSMGKREEQNVDEEEEARAQEYYEHADDVPLPSDTYDGDVSDEQ